MRRGARRIIEGDVREFVLDMTVDPGGPLDGKSIKDGGLRRLAGVFLVQVERGDRVIAPARPEVVLVGTDHLRFVGRADNVVDLHNIRGLSPAPQEHLTFDADRLAFFEVVVGVGSPLLGSTLKQVGFRGRYQAAVIAVHRADRRVEAKLGDIIMRVGDTLLVMAAPGWESRWRDRRDFLLVSRLSGSEPARSAKAPIVAVIGIGVVLAAATGLVDILESALVGAIAIVGFGVLTPDEAADALDLNVLIVIASAFGLGAAVRVTGLADRLADVLIDGLDGFGHTAVLAGLVVATVALTELVTNNAAAVLVFPIALSAAATLDQDPRSYAIAVALAASASFLTPIGYQTNTMV